MTDDARALTIKEKLILEALDDTDLPAFTISTLIGCSLDDVRKAGALDGIDLEEREKLLEITKQIEFLEKSLTRLKRERDNL
jgi:hypothetical protein